MPAPSLLQIAASFSGLRFGNVILQIQAVLFIDKASGNSTLENAVAKNKNKTKKTPQEKKQEEELPFNKPWVSMRGGIILMAIVSVALAIFIASQVIPSTGWLEGIGWGLLFGGMLWAIFFGNLWITKKLRK
jgi:hypothetical protein